MSRLRNHLINFIVILGLAIVLVVLDQGGRTSAPQDWSQRLTLPLEKWFSQVSQNGSDFISTIRDFSTLKAENETLRRQIDELMLVHVQNTELKKENERFRELLDFQESNPNYMLQAAEVVARETPARVIGQEASNLVQAVRIDQGRESGVEKGMSVITPRGLVGQVLESGQGWAKVLLVTDQTSYITALVQEGRTPGIVEGTGDGLIMRYIPHEEQIQPNDVILSAGLGGQFPKGLVLGTVESVQGHDVNPWQDAVLRSTIDFSQLEYVFIIHEFTAGELELEVE